MREEDVPQELPRADEHGGADGDGLLVGLGGQFVHEVPAHLALGVPRLGQQGYVLVRRISLVIIRYLTHHKT